MTAGRRGRRMAAIVGQNHPRRPVNRMTTRASRNHREGSRHEKTRRHRLPQHDRVHLPDARGVRLVLRRLLLLLQMDLYTGQRLQPVLPGHPPLLLRQLLLRTKDLLSDLLRAAGPLLRTAVLPGPVRRWSSRPAPRCER